MDRNEQFVATPFKAGFRCTLCNTQVGASAIPTHKCTPGDRKSQLAEQIRLELHRQMESMAPRDEDITIEVSEWEGYDEDVEDEPWVDPTYITIQAPHYHFHDAVLDLDASTIEEQAKFAVEQAIKG